MVGDRLLVLLLLLSLVTLPLLIVNGGGGEVHEKSKGIKAGAAVAEEISEPSNEPPTRLQSLKNADGSSSILFEAKEAASRSDGGKPAMGPEMELRFDNEAADRLPVRLL
jgi:hypothetical protein